MNSSKLLTIAATFVAFTLGARADVTGKITLKGTPTNPDKEVKTAADPKCKHDKPMMTENWKVGADGALADVVITIEGGSASPSATKPVIDQINCQYVPHVTAVTKGSTVTFQNTDATLHNVHCVEWHGRTQRPSEVFNFPQIHFAGPPKQDDKKFDKAGVYRLECNVHPWMNAWLVVTDTPWFAVSAADGTFKIPGVPDGEYTVHAWHGQYSTPLEQKIKVAGGNAEVKFEFDAAAAK